MYATRVSAVALTAFLLPWGVGCALDEVDDGRSSGEVSAAILGLKCDNLYCDCVDKWDWSEARCRGAYCEGGTSYRGGNAACAATAVDDPTRKCGSSYCVCIGQGRPPKHCRATYCEGGPHYNGGDAECFRDGPGPGPGPGPEPGPGLNCNKYYCDCTGLDGGRPWGGKTEADCRRMYCEGGTNYHGNPVKCSGGGPTACTKKIVPTPWRNGSWFASVSSWSNAHFATRNDNKWATFVRRDNGDGSNHDYCGPLTGTSNHLDLRGFNVAIPTGTKLTGVEARVKQRGGTFVEAWVYTSGGRSNQAANGRQVGPFTHFGGPRSLFGLPLTAANTQNGHHWGLSMRTQARAERDRCPIYARSEVDVIQLRTHYEVCE